MTKIKSITQMDKYLDKEKKDIDEQIEILNLEFDINHYEINKILGYYDEASEKEQRRRIWKLNILKHKEDEDFLKRMGLKKI